jgi:hypothetical protein
MVLYADRRHATLLPDPVPGSGCGNQLCVLWKPEIHCLEEYQGVTLWITELSCTIESRILKSEVQY